MFAQMLKDILDQISAEHKLEAIPDPKWKEMLSSRLAKNIRLENRRSFASGNPEFTDAGGWLFDFSTIELEPGINSHDESLAPKLLYQPPEWVTRDSTQPADFVIL